MALAGIRLRTAVVKDMETLAAIEQESFPDPSWTAADFLRYDCTVAEIQMPETEMPVIAGFLVSMETFPGTAETPPEREILNLAVAVDFRRLGIAKRLLNREIQRRATLHLEVRESNVAAVHLYRNAGFTDMSVRRNYYDNPVESAIVMCLKW
jgi:ribosomal-protein-alanine N-acetyltransferase